MDLQRTDGVSVHVSTQSNEVENVSSIVDWSKLVIEPEKDEDEEESLDEKGIPDEKPVNENAMFALLGLKTEADEDGMKLGPIVAPTPADLDDTKDVAILVDDMAQEEALIAWDERHPKMDIGTPYPDMAAFRKAIKQFAINGEFEYGTTKNEPARFRAFCKGQGIKGEPCQWCLSASWQRDQNCVMVVKYQTEHICSSTSGKVTSMTDQAWVAEKAAAMLKKDPTIGATKILHVLQDEYHVAVQLAMQSHLHHGLMFDVSVSNAVPSTPTKSKTDATCGSPGAVTRSQTASQASPGAVTRSQTASQAATPPPKSPAKGKKKKMTPKRRKLSEM